MRGEPVNRRNSPPHKRRIDSPPRRTRRVRSAWWRVFVGEALMIAGAAPLLHAQFEMPDPKQMSGIPRPVADLPDRTISVRLIRGALSNNITDFPVELHVGSTVKTVKTDESGRAQFAGLTAGLTVKAVAVVDGERLESQEFPVPERGGVRLMLVATDKSKGATPSSTTPVAG